MFHAVLIGLLTTTCVVFGSALLWGVTPDDDD